MAKYSSKDTTVSWGGTTLTNAATISTSITRDQIDVTDLVSTFREFVAAIPDGGTITVEGFLDPADTDIATLMTDIQGNTAKTLLITFPDAGAATFSVSALCLGLDFTAREGDALRFTARFKATGTVTYTP